MLPHLPEVPHLHVNRPLMLGKEFSCKWQNHGFLSNKDRCLPSNNNLQTLGCLSSPITLSFHFHVLHDLSVHSCASLSCFTHSMFSLGEVHRTWIYNYPLKGRWIMVGVYTKTQKHRGMYLVLWTNPKGDSCFSIYHIIWIEIKKELFVNKRHHLVRVCLRFNWRCFRDHFLWFVANSVRKFFAINQ